MKYRPDPEPSFLPARVQPIQGAGRKGSPGTRLLEITSKSHGNRDYFNTQHESSGPGFKILPRYYVQSLTFPSRLSLPNCHLPPPPPSLSHHTRRLGHRTRQMFLKHPRKVNQMDRLVIFLLPSRHCTTPVQQNRHGNLKRNYPRSQRKSFAGNSPMIKYVKSLAITVFHQLIV